MLRGIENLAAGSRLTLSRNEVWTFDADHSHIAAFSYDIGRDDEGADEPLTIGTFDGYRIVQDWTVEHDLEIWDEADALSADAVRYVEALIRELRVCELAFDVSPDLTTGQHITIARHVDAKGDVDLAVLTQSAVACLAMIDAPAFESSSSFARQSCAS